MSLLPGEDGCVRGGLEAGAGGGADVSDDGLDGLAAADAREEAGPETGACGGDEESAAEQQGQGGGDDGEAARGGHRVAIGRCESGASILRRELRSETRIGSFLR